MEGILAIDTATSQTVVALSGVGTRSVPSGQRHGALLLGALDELFAGPGMPSPRDLSGIVVGTGPGNFTGLRIGMATAKTIAYARRIPIVGVPTPVALARAAVDASPATGQRDESSVRVAMIQPAGPSDRYLSIVRLGAEGGDAELIEPPRVLSPVESIDDAVGDALLVAVDLPANSSLPAGTADAGDAIQRGHAAVRGLGGALLSLGIARLQAGRVDDAAELVPAYVTLPRGVIETAERVTWSPALR